MDESNESLEPEEQPPRPKNQDGRSGPLPEPVPPGKNHGPVCSKVIPLKDIDDEDQSMQFRSKPSTKPTRRFRASMTRWGQIKPIKVMAGTSGYIILDGFKREATAKGLGWLGISACIYPSMSEAEAKEISWRSNSERKKLSGPEKANAVLWHVNQGWGRDKIAELFGISDRQVERYLAVPNNVLRQIDAEIVTMAHEKTLTQVLKERGEDVVEELVEWIRRSPQPVTGKQLERHVRHENLLAKGSKRRVFGSIRGSVVKLRSFQLSRKSKPEDRASAVEFLRAVLAKLEAEGPDGSSSRE